MTSGAFRKDIQGLRAVAVLLVLAYHLWPEAMTGGFVGVDVFLVISGYLITAHLLQHPPRRGRDLLEFWGRRVRRLLPAAFLVLIVTAIASRVVAPETQWAAIAGQTIASALYVQNWVLASTSVDYLVAEEAPTPVQHYWTLSVEEQFYLFWPILLLAAFWLSGRLRLGPLGVVRLAMLVVVGLSLGISIVATAAEPASAYFITPTRVWELAAGGLIATLPPLGSLRIPGRVVDGAAWIGLAMILVAGATYSEATPFPGSAAILPIAGTALVILAAAEGAAAPTRLLGNRPIQHIGDTSYSIYLWHWPLIVLAPYVVDSVTPVHLVAILGLTLGLATLSKVLVEDPFRFAPALQPLKPTFRFAAVGMLLVSLLGGGGLLEAQLRVNAAVASGEDVDVDPLGEEGPWPDDPTPQPPSPAAPGLTPGATPGQGPAVAPPDPTPEPPDPTLGPDSCVGAAAIVRGFEACPQDPAAQMVPDPVAARRDVSAAYRDGCWIYAPFSDRTTCRYGDGMVRIALVGNSHGGHWLPALQVLAKRNGWTITTFLASRCNATDAVLELYSAAEGCLDYGRWVMQQTRGDAFDLVITSQRQSVRTQGDTWSETLPTAVAGYTSYLRRWSEAGTNVLILEDTPFPGRALPGTVPDCLVKHPTNQRACGGTPETWRSMDPLFTAATEAGFPGIATLATKRFFCTTTECPAVIGTVVVFWDASHLTRTYARSVAPFLEAEILAALDRGAD